MDRRQATETESIDRLHDAATSRAGRILGVAFAIALGVLVTLILRGYQFGKSNHTVYLLDAVRAVYPGGLGHDWYVTSTLQYHVIFGAITRWLMAAGLVQPGFLLMHLLSVVALHAAWLAIVFRVGGTIRTYLLSLMLFYLSAGGTGLGAFQFIQDGAFLPSNVANVAMLWGIYLWMCGRRGWAGATLGIAALWHINHAAVGIGLWLALSAWDAWRPVVGNPRWTGTQLLGGALLFALAAVNLVPALLAKLEPVAAPVSLDEFVRLYVYLRHPHHYGPRTWPAAVWICFLWSSIAALLATRRAWRVDLAPATRSAWIQGARVFAIFWALLLVGLLGAGFWFVSDSLIQLAVYRFSIYVQLLACVAVAWWVLDSGALRRGATVMWMILVALLIVLGALLLGRFAGSLARAAQVVHQNHAPLILVLVCALLAALHGSGRRVLRGGLGVALHATGLVVVGALIGIGWGRWLGLNLLPEDDPQYIEMAHWARDHTPVDALFLVPPGEQAFRLEARRAIYINFKGVAQLRGEIGTWRDRLREVLAMDDLSTLPHPFDRTLAAIEQRYRSLPTSHLVDVARRRGVRYILIDHPLDDPNAGQLVHRSSGGEFFLYDLQLVRSQ